MKTFELVPINGRKSFYRKAIVETNGNISDLRSFDTIVASLNHKTNKVTVNGWYSVTTANHINAFLDYYGKPQMSKKEMINFKN